MSSGDIGEALRHFELFHELCASKETWELENGQNMKQEACRSLNRVYLKQAEQYSHSGAIEECITCLQQAMTIVADSTFSVRRTLEASCNAIIWLIAVRGNVLKNLNCNQVRTISNWLKRATDWEKLLLRPQTTRQHLWLVFMLLHNYEELDRVLVELLLDLHCRLIIYNKD